MNLEHDGEERGPAKVGRAGGRTNPPSVGVDSDTTHYMRRDASTRVSGAFSFFVSTIIHSPCYIDDNETRNDANEARARLPIAATPPEPPAVRRRAPSMNDTV